MEKREVSPGHTKYPMGSTRIDEKIVKDMHDNYGRDLSPAKKQ